MYQTLVMKQSYPPFLAKVHNFCKYSCVKCIDDIERKFFCVHMVHILIVLTVVVVVVSTPSSA